MKPSIKSRLGFCQLPDSGDVSPYHVIGMVTDLAINQSPYNVRSVSAMIDRVTPALETGQARIFFDDERRPYGYASWVVVPESTHQPLLAGKCSDFELSTDFLSGTGSHLWFFDFLCPFCSPLAMLQRLKQELSNYSHAYLLRHGARSASTVRRLW